MDWKEAAEETVEDIKEDGLRGAAHDLNEEYGLDQKEFGKILFITSLAMLVTSAPAAMTMEEASSSLESANNNLNQVESILTSDGFQRNLEVLQSRISGELSTTLDQVSISIERTNTSVSNLESVQTEMEDKSNTYKWMSLISILGMVGGVVISYV